MAVSKNLMQIFNNLDENELESEIAFYQSKVEEYANSLSPHQKAMLRVYETLVDQRRRLLCAKQSGHPENWMQQSLA